MSKKDLYDNIVKLAVIFSKEIDKNLIMAYVDNLHQYNETDLKAVFNKITRSKKFFPKIAEFIELLEPQIDEVDSAQILANNIIETVLRLGRYSADKINAELIPQERYALMSIGGIEAICNIDISQLGTVRAQLRNSCRASIAKDKIEMFDSKRVENRHGMHKINFNEVLND